MDITLVTGATGFLGYHLVQRLLRDGRRVRLLVRSMAKARRLFPSAVEVCEGDLSDVASLKKAAEDVAVVYHAAGMPDQWVLDPHLFHQVNFQGTQNLLIALQGKALKKFVYVSTIETFRTEQAGTLDESCMMLQPKPFAYARSKQLADQEVWRAFERGLPAVFIHPTAMYGPHPIESWFIKFLMDFRANRIPALTSGGLPLVYVEDVAAGCLAAEEKGRPGERFILNERYMAWAEMGQVVAEELGMEKVPWVLPNWLGRICVQGMDIVSKWTKRPPLIFKSIYEFFQFESRPSSLKAQRELGWTPVAFAEGVKKTLHYLYRGTTNFEEPVACKFCKFCDRHPAAKDFGLVQGNTHRFKDSRFRIWRCPQCLSLQNIDPVSYEDIYRDYPLNKRKPDFFARATMSNLLGRLQGSGLATQHRVLDYGCGNGLFMNFLKERGFTRVDGYDPFVDPFKNKPASGAEYDWVVLNDTIEHADDFQGMVREALELVKPGGYLYIGTPDTRMVDMANLEAQITKLHQPYHRLIASHMAIRELGREQGVECIKTFERSYHDTLRPFANYRFLDELLKAHGHDMEQAMSPAAGLVILKRPWLLFYACFGYFLPSAFEPAVILRKPG